MKRFHVHVAVTDLAQAVGFYSALLGAEPAVRKADYAKWMLDDPAVNFAISSRGAAPGVNHLGLQFDSDEELNAVEARLDGAAIPGLPERGAACCYARSDKYWVTDPAGVAWEQFHTTGAIELFGAEPAGAESACCAPGPAEGGACCGEDASNAGCC